MNSEIVIQAAASAIATYGIHSTLVLLTACLVSRCVAKHAAIRERIWKWCTVIPLFSTAFVLCWPQTQPVWDWRLNSSPTTSIAVAESQPALTTPAHVNVPSITKNMEPTAVLDSDVGVGSLLPERTIDNANLAVPESHGTASANVDGEFNDDWVVQIIPGKPSIDPHSSPARRRPETTVSLAPSSIKAKPSKPDAATIARAVGNSSSLQESSEFRSTSQTNVREDMSFSCLLIAVFAAVFALFGISRLMLIRVRITRILGRSRTINDGRTAKLLRQLLADRNIRNTVCVLSSDAVSEPAATGVWHWTIVLPRDLPSRLSDSELSALLCHELGHLVRRDTAWLHFGRLMTALIPWQLLNFVAIQKWQQSAELECDDWTLNSNVEPLTLAKVLTKVAEWKTGNRPSVGLPATAPPFSLRIEALLNRSNRPRKSRSKLQKLLLITMLICTSCGVSIFGPRMTWASPEKIEAVVLPLGSFPSRLSLAETEELSNLRAEFHSLSADLQVALELLATQETDSNIDEIMHKITNRLKQIELDIHQKGLEL